MTTAAQEELLAKRDLTIDLARVACVLLVVVIHTLFTGVRETASGIEIEKTVELQSWFDALSWIFEIMPLFFVVGGFASAAAFRSARRKGQSSAGYLRGRILRLARPALPVFAFFAAALLAASLLPVDPSLVAGIAVGIGSPLWFLSSFLIAQATVPVFLGWHERRPFMTLLALVLLALIVDLLRWVTLDDRYGVANVLIVWPAVQQLGFFLHDGWFARRRAWELLGLVALAYLGLWGSVTIGDYSTNMLQNQYPPTCPLILLGVAQAAMLTLLKRPLAALMRARAMQGLVLWVGSRAMTIYCWHMPVILVLVGIMLVMPGQLTEPGTPRWWLERIPFVLAVLAAIGVMSIWLRRFEAPPRPLAPGETAPGLGRVLASLAVFCLAPFLIMMLGLDLPLALLGLTGTLATLALLRPRRAGLVEAVSAGASMDPAGHTSPTSPTSITGPVHGRDS